MSLSSFAKRIVGKKIAKVVTLKNVAYVAPYTAALTSGGRTALADTYGGVAKGLSSHYGGQAAGGVFGAVVDRFATPPPALAPDGTSSADYDPNVASAPARQAAPGTVVPAWAWGILAVVGGIAALLFVRGKKRS